MKWEAEVVEYVDFVSHATAIPRNSKAGTPPSTLNKTFPLLGPRFCPPLYLHTMKRDTMPSIVPEGLYLKSLTVVHPTFFPGMLGVCPQCASTDIIWDGWNATGAREVHGIWREERAIGYQLRCKTCREKYGKGRSEHGAAQYCFATTSQFFWKGWEHWRIPCRQCSSQKMKLSSHTVGHRNCSLFFESNSCDT